MKTTPNQMEAIAKLNILLYKLGIKSAKLNTAFSLNMLFKQCYAAYISDLQIGQSSSLFGINPQTYAQWKSNEKLSKK